MKAAFPLFLLSAKIEIEMKDNVYYMKFVFYGLDFLERDRLSIRHRQTKKI